MALPRRIALLVLVVLTACSGSHGVKRAKAEEPWSHAYSGASGAWWTNWNESLHGKQPFGPGTRFEREIVGPDGERRTEVIEVLSITPNATGSFSLQLQVTADGNASSFKSTMPGDLAYSPGSAGSITARNEDLVEVTVPAGTFSAGRLWKSEAMSSTPYERDIWVVPDVPVPVQEWSRPVSDTALYNPPADGTMPAGTQLIRLVRIDRQ